MTRELLKFVCFIVWGVFLFIPKASYADATENCLKNTYPDWTFEKVSSSGTEESKEFLAYSPDEEDFSLPKSFDIFSSFNSELCGHIIVKMFPTKLEKSFPADIEIGDQLSGQQAWYIKLQPFKQNEDLALKLSPFFGIEREQIIEGKIVTSSDVQSAVVEDPEYSFPALLSVNYSFGGAEGIELCEGVDEARLTGALASKELKFNDTSYRIVYVQYFSEIPSEERKEYWKEYNNGNDACRLSVVLSPTNN